MLFIIGAIFFVFSFFGTIRLIMMIRRPKAEALVTELFSAKLKTDVYKMMPEQLHARVKFIVDEKEYSGEMPVLKTMVIKEGDYIPVYYKKEDPREVTLVDNRKNWIMLVVTYIVSIGMMAVSVILSNR